MRKTRELVTGKYINYRTYVLYREDGSIFQTIREGEPFQIDNQMREWEPVRVPKKNGRGTILVCRKFANDGSVMGEFPLVHNKKGLWALTSGAARRGVFHNYREPQSDLERQLESMNVSRRIIERVDRIDETLREGVRESWSGITRYKFGFETYHDGWYRIVDGDLYDIHTVHVHDSTYLVWVGVNTYPNGVIYRLPHRVILTPGADEKKVIELLRELEARNLR